MQHDTGDVCTIGVQEERAERLGGSGLLALQRIAIRLVKGADGVAIEATSFDLEERADQPGSGAVFHDVLDGLGAVLNRRYCSRADLA